ncbi:MAG: sodium:proton antiporter [Gemmataceae bacterium]|nr:sodium:proton antiporter [Gemmataceae bacterium]
MLRPVIALCALTTPSLRAGFVLTGLLLWPGVCWAADDPLNVDVWSVAPFVGLLLSIAILPLVAGHFWHSNFRKALVSLLFAAPVVAYLYFFEEWQGQDGMPALKHALDEYLEFIILLASLYTVAGGIVLQGYVAPTPMANTFLLATGAVLANFIGTTGASMLLIRPFLRINAHRVYNRHLPVFFIFSVSNLGGLLTPLGDPPLFLGFLRGIDFFWTIQLWPQWLVANGCVLTLFLVWDGIAYFREPNVPSTIPTEVESGPLRLRGKRNFLFLAGILAAALLTSQAFAQEVQGFLMQFFQCPDLTLQRPWPAIVILAMAVLSLLFTPGRYRAENQFTWGAIIEVAVLFIGIFITMVPALELLRGHGEELGITEPWQYFWYTGGLSSFLDNAPTYLAFTTIAAGDQPIASLMIAKPHILAAISCGAVFMGASTYIGNGPNFMVKSIADSMGYRTPSFFGYMAYSIFLLLPIFVLVTWLFFWPL